MPDNQKIKLRSTTKKILEAFSNGTGIMLVQAPLVNALNQWSVVACRYNLSDLPAFNAIFTGRINQGGSSFLNFGAGMGGHLSKEVPRLFFKSTGLYIYKPWLGTQFSPNYADLIFALTLSSTEIIINPADTWRVNIQAGVKLERSLRRLYAGSIANGVRQFGTWWGFGYSNQKLNTVLLNNTTINPNSLTGMMIKAYPQSLFFTSMVYWIERIKNEIQYKKNEVDIPVFPKKNQYLTEASIILKTQGWLGFYRGFHPKVLSNSILAFGANALVELGQRRMSKG